MQFKTFVVLLDMMIKFQMSSCFAIGIALADYTKLY